MASSDDAESALRQWITVRAALTTGDVRRAVREARAPGNAAKEDLITDSELAELESDPSLDDDPASDQDEVSLTDECAEAQLRLILS